MILAGDVGGTKANLGLFDDDASKINPIAQATFASKNFNSLEDIVGEFLKNQAGEPTRAAFGVACAIVEGRCDATNLPWKISEQALKNKLKMQRVSLINDLQAMALGVTHLPETSFYTLNAGERDPKGSRAVIAAGTGLGEAGLVWTENGFRVLASEGGHSDFAPRNDLEIDLLKHLMKKFGRVSFERALSGPGLFNIYTFLVEHEDTPTPSWLVEQMEHDDPSAVITATGLAGTDEICHRALQLFVSIYGAEAGNLALKFFASGGVYIGGGIAPKILSQLKDGTFMESFVDKGRLSVFLEALPVKVILDPNAPLWGAAAYGRSL